MPIVHWLASGQPVYPRANAGRTRSRNVPFEERAERECNRRIQAGQLPAAQLGVQAHEDDGLPANLVVPEDGGRELGAVANAVDVPLADLIGPIRIKSRAGRYRGSNRRIRLRVGRIGQEARGGRTVARGGKAAGWVTRLIGICYDRPISRGCGFLVMMVPETPGLLAGRFTFWLSPAVVLPGRLLREGSRSPVLPAAGPEML